MRGYKPGRFSFNVKGGRCEACQGDGIIRIEMQFLPDVYVPCEVCHGKRYNREALEIKYKGKSIADVLDMTVDEALEFFQHIPGIRNKLDTLQRRRPGLHPAGPAGHHPLRRRGAARQAEQRAEPPRHRQDPLHPGRADHRPALRRRAKLLTVLQRLVDQGNTVVVIEHNLDVIKCADWMIDLGPEGGEAGGWVIAEGTPGARRARRDVVHRPIPAPDPGRARGAATERGHRGAGQKWLTFLSTPSSIADRCGSAAAVAPGSAANSLQSGAQHCPNSDT